MEDGSAADRSRGAGERERVGDGGGGLQRQRADAMSNRNAGRPMAQRARNASFAMPRMRSPSFLTKEKGEDIPDANASPWGVEETDADKREKAKEFFEKQMQASLVKKVSLSFSNISSPTSPGSTLHHSSTGLSPNSIHSAKSVGIRKSISMFGGKPMASPAVPNENVTMKAFTGAPESPTTPTTPSNSFKDSPNLERRRSVIKLSIDQDLSPKQTQKTANSEELASTPSKTGQKEEEAPLGPEKRSVSHRVRAGLLHQHGGEENGEKGKGKHKKKGLGSKLRSAMHGTKKEGEKDGSDSDGDDGGTGDGGAQVEDISSPDENGVVTFKDPSMREDDFVSYQTKPKDEKKWKPGRKTRMLK